MLREKARPAQSAPIPEAPMRERPTEALEKLFQRVVALKVFEQSLNGYARSLEHRSAAKDIGSS